MLCHELFPIRCATVSVARGAILYERLHMSNVLIVNAVQQ